VGVSGDIQGQDYIELAILFEREHQLRILNVFTDAVLHRPHGLLEISGLRLMPGPVP
jgi:hypothetical protein